MALIADEYTWVAGTVSGDPSVESPQDGHHTVVRFALTTDRTGGATAQQAVEARGATAKYLLEKHVAKGDFVIAAGIFRTPDSHDQNSGSGSASAGSEPYLLLRVVSTDTSESLGSQAQ